MATCSYMAMSWVGSVARRRTDSEDVGSCHSKMQKKQKEDSEDALQERGEAEELKEALSSKFFPEPCHLTHLCT